MVCDFLFSEGLNGLNFILNQFKRKRCKQDKRMLNKVNWILFCNKGSFISREVSQARGANNYLSEKYVNTKNNNKNKSGICKLCTRSFTSMLTNINNLQLLRLKTTSDIATTAHEIWTKNSCLVVCSTHICQWQHCT